MDEKDSEIDLTLQFLHTSSPKSFSLPFSSQYFSKPLKNALALVVRPRCLKVKEATKCVCIPGSHNSGGDAVGGYPPKKLMPL